MFANSVIEERQTIAEIERRNLRQTGIHYHDL